MSEERWHETERLRRLEAENEKLMLRASELDKAHFDLRNALLKGPMTSGVDRGYHQLIMSFESLADLIEARKAIYHAIRKRDPNETSTT